MRLTLRTMLAYMDDILEPEDSKAIGQKIEESEFATSLLHRTRDVMRRLRLGTPSVTERGAGLDPNTVAEYLDNTLPHERVLDFEKVCLESDVHLSEVASCHQILALVLGEPAEVEMTTRQRMYRLPELVKTRSRAAADAPDVSAPTSAEGSPVIADERRGDSAVELGRSKSRVPEWLRAQTPRRLRWWPAAAVSIAVLCLVAVLVVSGQFGQGSYLAGLFGWGRTDASTAQTTGSVEPEAPSPAGGQIGADRQAEAQPSEPKPSAGQPGRSEQTAASDIEMGPASGVTDRPQGPIPPDRVGVRREGEAGPLPEGPASRPQLGAGRVAEDQPAVVAGADQQPGSPKVDSSVDGSLAQPRVADVVIMAPDKQGLERIAAEAGPEGGPESRPGREAPLAAAPLPPEPVGQLDSPAQVLARFDSDAGRWLRVADQGHLLTETVYLALPTYRPVLQMVDDSRIQLVDATRVEMLPTDPAGVLGLVVDYGRLMIEAAADGSRLRLQFGDRAGVIGFGGAGSKVAIEVGRIAGSGTDPETQPAPLTADLYATSGRIVWQEQGCEAVAVTAPVRLRLNEQPLEAVAVENLPSWVVHDTMSLLDQRAAETVERELEVERAAMLSLRELVDHRRREVRWLALRSLAQLGDFELLVAGLDDPEEKPVWPDYIGELRAAAARSPLAAAQVRSTMEKLHGDEGASLYEMLWKYDSEALDIQDANQLVRFLDHDTLAFRVLSFWNLKRITGLRLFYEPEQTAAQRRVSVSKWRERLKSLTVIRRGPDDAKAAPSGGRKPPQFFPDMGD